jgi:DNA-binding transcriptional ArsR family regulator
MNRFAALADPTRRQIVERLSLGELSFGEIADNFEMSRPAVSQHLKVLRNHGLVSVRADAQRRIYGLDADGFEEIDAWLRKVRRFWNANLDTLERELKKETNGE